MFMIQICDFDTLHEEELCIRRSSEDREHMNVNMHLLRSGEVWQEWKNKVTTSPGLKACVFIDEA